MRVPRNGKKIEKKERHRLYINAAHGNHYDDERNRSGARMVLKTDHILMILSIYEGDSI